MLRFAVALVVVVVLAGAAARLLIARSRLPWLGRVVGLAYITRFGWIPAALLVLIPAAGWRAGPDGLAGLFAVPEFGAFGIIGFAAVVAAVAVVAGVRVAGHNAPGRFADARALHEAARRPYPLPPPATRPALVAPPALWAWVVGLAAPVVLVCARDPGGACRVGWAAVGLAVVGGLVAVGVFYLLARVEARTFRPDERFPHLFLFRLPDPPAPGRLWGKVGDRIRRMCTGLGPGYAGPGGAAPGHGQLVLFGVAVGCGYAAAVAAGYAGVYPLTTGWAPPPALLLGLAAVVSLAGSAAGFYLDYRRIPVVATAVLWSVALFWLTQTDHYYYVNPDDEPRPGWYLLLFWCLLAALAGAGGVVALLGPGRRSRVGAAMYVAGYLFWVGWPGGGASVGEPPAPTPTVIDLSREWEIPAAWPDPERDSTRVLVVVSASGGGIQASAWTAKVLTGLHERYGARFTRSVRLISAVSGGSLGTAAYLSRWNEKACPAADPFPGKKADMDAVNAAARRPGLAAAVWGLAGPDVIRLGFPAAVPDHFDRGRALEGEWRAGFGPARAADWRLRHVGEPAARGRMPAVVFNAVLAETGQRLLIGSNTLTRSLEVSPAAGVEFHHLFPKAGELPVTTAVRLSATFPFVSPLSRPRSRTHYDYTTIPDSRDAAYKNTTAPLHTCHVVDGGYVDNEGLVTAATTVDALLAEYTRPEAVPTRPFDAVVLLRIMPFPARPDEQPAEYSANGWLNELTGPPQALMNVRTSSQVERNGLLVKNLIRVWEPHVGILNIPVYFDPPPGSGVAPLSWSLTGPQEAAIDAAWAKITARKAWRDVANPVALPGIAFDAIGALDDLFGAPDETKPPHG